MLNVNVYIVKDTVAINFEENWGRERKMNAGARTKTQRARTNNENLVVSKKKKKKNVVIPQNVMDNESLELVASPIGPIRTKPVTTTDAQIILDRLAKEIVQKFGFTLSPVGKSDNSKKRKRVSNAPVPVDPLEEKKMKMTNIAKSRIVVGTNSCTRVFEKLYARPTRGRDASESSESSSTGKPSLCLMARDVRPPAILSHIPYFCHQMNVPIILIPGNATHDLGCVLGGNKVSVLLFRERPSTSTGENGVDCQYHDMIDSYIAFAKLKVS